jgi:hypothetical protein
VCRFEKIIKTAPFREAKPTGNIDEFETRGLAHASVIANQVRCHVYVFVKWSEIGVAVSNGDQPGTIALGW